MLDRRLKHVRVDEDREHAQGFVLLDEAHPAHVCGEIVDLRRAAGSDFAVFLQVEIEADIFDVVESLIPLMKRFNVDRADRRAASAPQIRDESTADETTCAGYDNSAVRI